MNDLSALAGRLQVEVLLRDGRIEAVETRLQRPLVQISRLLVGQAPEQALARLPLLFALCASAQQVAAVRALEQAAGWQPVAEVEGGRTRLSELELLRESLLRLVRDWQLPLPAERLKSLLGLCQRGIALLQPLCAMGAAPLASDGRLADILGELAECWRTLVLPSPDDWLQPRLQRWREVALGGPLPAVFEPADIPPLLERLRAGESEASIGGEPRITGPAAFADGGAPAAMQIAQRVAALLRRAEQAATGQPVRPPVAEDLLAEEGVGLAQTARGWLLHRVRLSAGRVAVWQFLAPTDWNFHADGLLRRQLLGVQVAEEECEALLRELILSADPCVAFEVRIAHA